jgi:hypothetical protein
MADSEKKTYNHLSQKAYEELMDKSMKNVVKKNEAMARKINKAWVGEPKDLPSADATESKINQKEKK